MINGLLGFAFSILRFIFGSQGQAEGQLKERNNQLEKENEIIKKQRDSNVVDMSDADKLFSNIRKNKRRK